MITPIGTGSTNKWLTPLLTIIGIFITWWLAKKSPILVQQQAGAGPTIASQPPLQAVPGLLAATPQGINTGFAEPILQWFGNSLPSAAIPASSPVIVVQPNTSQSGVPTTAPAASTTSLGTQPSPASSGNGTGNAFYGFYNPIQKFFSGKNGGFVPQPATQPTSVPYNGTPVPINFSNNGKKGCKCGGKCGGSNGNSSGCQSCNQTCAGSGKFQDGQGGCLAAKPSLQIPPPIANPNSNAPVSMDAITTAQYFQSYQQQMFDAANANDSITVPTSPFLGSF